MMENTENKQQEMPDALNEILQRGKYIWEVVRDLEQSKTNTEKELHLVRSTLILNFGPDQTRNPKLVIGDEGTERMLTTVLLNLYKPASQYKELNAELLEGLKSCSVILDNEGYHSMFKELKQLITKAEQSNLV